MPGTSGTVVLQNNATGELEARSLDTYQADVASGAYMLTPGSTVRTDRMGATVASAPDVAQAQIQGGEQFNSGAAAAYEAHLARRDEAFNNPLDKALVFAEGVVDAGSLGFISNQSEEGQARRDANSFYDFAGQAVGTVASLGLGPVKTLTAASGGAGRALTRSLMGEAVETVGGRILARATEEAAIGAVMMGATALGHQLTGAVIYDKDFSAEAIANEATMGGLLGFGLGALGGVASAAVRSGEAGILRATNRAEVKAQNGLLDAASAESKALHTKVRDGLTSFDDALAAHETRLTIADQLAKEGHFPASLMKSRKAALSEAQKAKKAFEGLDMDAALMGVDSKAYVKWRDAMETYQGKLTALDDVMRIGDAEAATIYKARVNQPHGTAPDPARANTQINVEAGAQSQWAGDSLPVGQRVDEVMARTPGATENYERLHGRPWENMPTEAPIQRPGLTPQQNAEAFTRLRSEILEAGPPTKPLGSPGDKPGPSSAKTEGKQAVDRFMNRWAEESRALGGTVTPADAAAAKLGQTIEDIRNATGGALDSAGATDILGAEGLGGAATSFGSQLDQVVAARRLGRAVADASRGPSATAAATTDGWLKTWFGRAKEAVSSKAGNAVFGGMIGGPPGAILGSMFGEKTFGVAGKIAGAAGRLAQTTGKVADALLSGNRSLGVTSAVTSAFANRPVAYSDAGPIKDPALRILEVQKMAASPEAIAAYINQRLGDIALIHPDIAGAIVATTTNRIQNLAAKAPQLAWDRLGNPIPPGSQEVRRWLAYENATNDYELVLAAIRSGNATDEQYDALRTQHPGVQSKLTAQLLADPDKLKDLPRSRLKVIENVVGMPLSQTADPAFVARQQEAWKVHNSPPPQQAPTPPAPTPTQASSRAPGNY